jgi:hypothetical protein
VPQKNAPEALCGETRRSGRGEHSCLALANAAAVVLHPSWKVSLTVGSNVDDSTSSILAGSNAEFETQLGQI